MNGYEYACKSASHFKKKFPNTHERKEKKPVFIDPSLLDTIKDIPDEIKTSLICKAKVSRMNRDEFAINMEDSNGHTYYLDIDCSCYDFYKNDKLLYSVLRIDGARWSIYKADIYGCYADSDLPVMSGSLNWNKNSNNKLNRIDLSDK